MMSHQTAQAAWVAVPSDKPSECGSNFRRSTAAEKEEEKRAVGVGVGMARAGEAEIGSMARVAQLFREFERVAVAPSSLSSTSSSTDDDVSGGNRNRKLRVWTPATFDKLIAAATATETATNDAGGIIPTESTGGGWRKGVLLLFNAIAQEDREDVDGHCGEGNGVGCEHISFVAFLRAFGCAMRGTREDHAKFLLRLLDPESSGFVTQDSLEQ
eukprot:INCI16284.12.p1 GENE.INCI16284.12~~INCI16284.12.p1  ORF type:complete len:214 (+),score=35.90 INCI16284.12:208-849(+)